MILNLKPLNNYIVYHHFEMDTINTCMELMHSNCLMASIDLQEAYYSIPIHNEHQKYLKAESTTQCEQSVDTVLQMLTKLGFYVNLGKS